jgi:hypothetical protein
VRSRSAVLRDQPLGPGQACRDGDSGQACRDVREKYPLVVSRVQLVGIAMLALLLASCRLDATVTVEMDTGGDGTIRIEAVADQELIDEAARFGGGNPIDDLRTADLEATGWTVTKDARARRVTLEHRFRTPQELGALVAGLDPGAKAPVLSTFSAQRDHGLFSDSYRFAGKVDITGGGSSEPLRDLLSGLDPALVNRVAGADLSKSFHLVLRARLPGRLQSDNTARRDGAGFLEWPLDAGQSVAAMEVTRRLNILTIAAGAGVALLVLLVLVLSASVALATRRGHGA